MKINKKILISTLLIATIMSTVGCSNSSNDKAKENNNLASTKVTSSQNGKINIDEDVKKFYDYLMTDCEKSYKQEREKQSDPLIIEQLDKKFSSIKNNIPTFMELNQKAKNSCANGFYVEYDSISSKNKNEKIKIFSSNENIRTEDYEDGKLAYLNIYSKDKDTYYEYDVNKDDLKTVTEYSKKNKGQTPYKLGFFPLWGNNAPQGDINFIDYEGKKVLYSEFKDSSNFVSKSWYDAQTGIIIKEEQLDLKNNAVQETYTTNYSIKFNQNYDKETFTFNKNKLNK